MHIPHIQQQVSKHANKTKPKYATLLDETAGNSNSYEEIARRHHIMALWSGSKTFESNNTQTEHLSCFGFCLQHLPQQKFKNSPFTSQLTA